MRKAVIFDVDGTLIDSVDFHALAWHEAFAKFGHAVSFEAARSQIGKGGDQLLPVFLSEATISEQGEEIEKWRGDRFKSAYLALVRPFSAVPELMNRLRQAGVAVAVASSAKKEELGAYLDIADVTHLVDVTVSSDDAEVGNQLTNEISLLIVLITCPDVTRTINYFSNACSMVVKGVLKNASPPRPKSVFFF